MRSVAVVAVLLSALAACGGDSPDDGARPTSPATSVDDASDPTVPTSTFRISPSADSEPMTTDTTSTTIAVTTPATTSPVVERPPSSDGGLGETIGVSDSVTIVVLDPED